MMPRFAVPLACALILCTPVRAQEPQIADVPQEAPLTLISDLAEILGRAHAVRTLCNGDQDVTWRNYMVNMMSYEAPSGPRRASVTEAFNRGYRSQTRETPACSNASAQIEAGIAARGKALADEIARIYMQ